MAHYKIHYKDNGSQFWYKNNVFHRVNGPAVIYHDGEKRWYQNGKRH
jgi:hypothetical protein